LFNAIAFAKTVHCISTNEIILIMYYVAFLQNKANLLDLEEVKKYDSVKLCFIYRI